MGGEGQKDRGVCEFGRSETRTSCTTDLQLTSNTSRQQVAGDPDIIGGQAGAFSESCNIYMPKYRELGFFAQIWYNLSNCDETKLETFNQHLQLAAADLKSAFLAFLRDRPDSTRPFIVAGHSQGAVLLTKVLAECVQGTPHENLLVAAYLAGGCESEKRERREIRALTIFHRPSPPPPSLPAPLHQQTSQSTSLAPSSPRSRPAPLPNTSAA